MKKFILLLILICSFSLALYLANKITSPVTIDEQPLLANGQMQNDGVNTSTASSVTIPVNINNQSSHVNSPLPQDEQPIKDSVIKSCTDIEENNDKTVINQELNQLLALKSLSTSPNDVTLSMVLARLLNKKQHASESEVSFESALGAPEQSPLLVHQLIISCLSQSDAPQCQTPLEHAAIQADPDNGWLLLEAASIRLKQADAEAAKRLINQALTKPVFNDYFYDYATFFAQETAGFINATFSQRIALGAGISPSAPSGFSRIIENCKTTTNARTLDVETCYQLGLRLKENSMSFILQAMGVGLLNEHYKRENNIEMIKYYEQWSLEQYDIAFNEQWHQATLLAQYDESLMHHWLTVGKNYGEVVAAEQLTIEAKQRSQNPDYNPCPAQTIINSNN